MHAEVVDTPALGGLVEIAPGLALAGVAMTFDANEEIYAEEQPADFVYKVISGAARTTRLLSDGGRQIGAFYLPGDVFGMQCGERHRFSAEAVTLSQIALVRRSALERAAESDSATARRLWSLTSHELEDIQDHVLLLGRKDAVARVGHFLLRLAMRVASPVLDLPMTRSDIADHLGLTLETVSRTMSQLAREEAIALPSARRVVLCDPAALAMA